MLKPLPTYNSLKCLVRVLSHASIFASYLVCHMQPLPPMKTTAFFFLALLTFPAAAQDTTWTPLFDGETLDGWQNPYDWGEADVVDGEIHLLGDKKFFLVTEKPYRDFVYEGEIMMPDTGRANSGFMFRANVEPNKVYGYQAEVDPSERSWSGGIYDEGRRGWLSPNRDDSASVDAFTSTAGGPENTPYQHGAWNKYRIHAEGDSLKIYVNGVQTTATADTTDRQGYLGIQHHGEEGQTYRFRNLRVYEISPAEPEK